jgi:hypothetical protein
MLRSGVKATSDVFDVTALILDFFDRADRARHSQARQWKHTIARPIHASLMWATRPQSGQVADTVKSATRFEPTGR